MMPKAMRVSPFCANAGIMVCSGRFLPASALGEDESRLKSAPRFCSSETGAFRDDAGAKCVVIALDQRDHVAVAIHHREIGGVARAGQRSGNDIAIGVIGIDEFGAIRRVVLGKQCFDRQILAMRDRRYI